MDFTFVLATKKPLKFVIISVFKFGAFLYYVLLLNVLIKDLGGSEDLEKTLLLKHVDYKTYIIKIILICKRYVWIATSLPAIEKIPWLIRP